MPRILSEAQRAAMRTEMNRLFRILVTPRVLALRCFCAPLACHGDVIARVLLEKLEERRRLRLERPPAE